MFKPKEPSSLNLDNKLAKEAEGRLFFGVEVGARFQKNAAEDGPAIGGPTLLKRCNLIDVISVSFNFFQYAMLHQQRHQMALMDGVVLGSSAKRSSV